MRSANEPKKLRIRNLLRYAASAALVFWRSLLASLAPRLVPYVIKVGKRYPVALPIIAHAAALARFDKTCAPPYEGSAQRPACTADQTLLPARPKAATRSVLFLHNSYYHFYHLAKALRRRGWDAVLVTMHDPQGPAASYFHGEDVNLFDPHAPKFHKALRSLYHEIPSRFRMVHFSGVHHMSVFPRNFDRTGWVGAVPWDFLELKRKGVKIGYTISGCNDGVSQSAFFAHTKVCTKCIWQLHPEACSDQVNLAWGRKLDQMCDLVSVEGDWALESRCGRAAFREPLTMCLDPEVWNPNMTVPDSLRIPRSPDELVVLHGFGNKDIRTRQGRDIKGSRAVHAAVQRLVREGRPIRFVAPEAVPSRDMRFLQVQADIIVDQVNYGRYGAQAREGLMLGKPTVCYLENRQGPGLPPLRSLAECPLVSATEASVYDVLRHLVDSPAERHRVGALSRRYALKWHSADACALRFERVYDRLMLGLAPESDDVFDGMESRCAA